MGLVRASASLSFMFVLLVGAAVLFGRQQPPAAIMRQLHLTKCAPPCWNDMMPLQQDAGTSIQHLLNEFGLDADTAPNFLTDETDSSWSASWGTSISISPKNQPAAYVPIMFYFSFGTNRWEKETITQILIGGSLPTTPYMPTIGDIVSAFGAPTCVYISPLSSQGWFLIYDAPEGATAVNVLGRSNRLSWGDRIYSLIFRAHTSSYGEDECHSTSDGYYLWSGLLSRQQYQQMPSLHSAFEQG